VRKKEIVAEEGLDFGQEEEEITDPVNNKRMFYLAANGDGSFLLTTNKEGEQFIIEVDSEKGFIGLPLEFQHSMRQFKKEDIANNP
jgi:hypothetical protein